MTESTESVICGWATTWNIVRGLECQFGIVSIPYLGCEVTLSCLATQQLTQAEQTSWLKINGLLCNTIMPVPSTSGNRSCQHCIKKGRKHLTLPAIFSTRTLAHCWSVIVMSPSWIRSSKPDGDLLLTMVLMAVAVCSICIWNTYSNNETIW